MFETKQCQEFVCGVQARKLLEQLDECAELRLMVLDFFPVSACSVDRK